jgi:hypothetical protein
MPACPGTLMISPFFINSLKNGFFHRLQSIDINCTHLIITVLFLHEII